MSGASDFEKRVRQLVPKQGLRFQISTVSEAKQALAEIRQIQKELRLIKRQMNDIMKAIRAKYASQSGNAGSSGATMMRLLGGKGAARKHQADAKRRLKVQRDKELQPYDSVKRLIDDALVNADRSKLQIEQWMAAAKNEDSA